MSLPSKSTSPPTYSPRNSPPAYSSTSRPTERTLERSRGRSQSPSGVCIRRSGDVTLTIFGQENNIAQPLVRPGAPLSGSVLLHDAENVKSVVLTIEGHLEILPTAGSYSSIPLFSITNRMHTAGAPACPNSFVFSQSFPSAFRHDGRVCTLPPTCHITFSSVYFIKCVYRITVLVTSARHRRASFLTRSDHVSLELTYRPRTRPARPLLLNPSLHATIKACPEEWAQGSHMVQLSSSGGPPLFCDLFAPAIGAFCVLEPIPFHLQLSAAHGSLQNLFKSLPTVKVGLLRRVAMDAGGRMATQSVILGEGTIRLLPANGSTLNWEGEVHCRDPAAVVGTFECGTLVMVTDMLMVGISPPPHEVLGWPTFQFGYEIKLTTHKWDY
ncbi:hypothetical protein C8R46DRAFT_61840 [Mycena filopes]|nr:hypothetical protein C8R46DRAFT_61840 [Mycena filopes]